MPIEVLELLDWADDNLDALIEAVHSSVAAEGALAHNFEVGVPAADYYFEVENLGYCSQDFGCMAYHMVVVVVVDHRDLGSKVPVDDENEGHDDNDLQCYILFPWHEFPVVQVVTDNLSVLHKMNCLLKEEEAGDIHLEGEAACYNCT